MKLISPNKHIALLLCLLALILSASEMRGDDSVPSHTAFMQRVAASYTPWQSVELNGKLHTDRLPLSPGLRIFMQHGQSIIISVRAPFLGEVGRLELDGNTLTAVNKMRKIYVREDISGLLGNRLPVNITDIQDILLARAFILDYGTLSPDNMSLCSVYTEPDCMLLVPLSQPADGRVRYGYTFDFSARLQDFYVTTQSENYAALIEYSYKSNKTNMNFGLQMLSKTYAARLELDEPKWNPEKSLTPIEINSSWRQVDISTFLRSF